MNKILWIILVFILLINTNLYARMIQPSSEDLRISRENLQKNQATIKYVPVIDKVVETYSKNRVILSKLSFQILRAKAKLTSKPIRTIRQRYVLAILNYIDLQVSLALYKIYKTK